MDYRAALISGVDIPFSEAELIIHQPLAKEISQIGETDYFTGAQLLCFNKSMLDQDKIDLSNQSDFQIFMTVMSQPEAKKQKDSVINTLSLLFPSQQVIFTPRSMMIGGKMIDDSNFLALQEILKDICCIKSQLGQAGGYNPADRRAKEIADKLAEANKKIAKQKGEEDASVISQYTSILAVGLQLSLREVNEYTLYQIFDQVERFGLWVAWDIDIKGKLAGATSDSKPDNWMKNIH